MKQTAMPCATFSLEHRYKTVDYPYRDLRMDILRIIELAVLLGEEDDERDQVRRVDCSRLGGNLEQKEPRQVHAADGRTVDSEDALAVLTVGSVPPEQGYAYRDDNRSIQAGGERKSEIRSAERDEVLGDTAGCLRLRYLHLANDTDDRKHCDNPRQL